MAFLETPRFPVDLSYGSFGGPEFKTEIVQYANGVEYINSRWSAPRYRANAKYLIRTRTDALNVYQFFLATLGRAKGFRVRDLWDYTTAGNGVDAPTDTDQALGTGDNSTVAFQLKKTYTKGALSVARNLTKPVSLTDVIALNGTPQTRGADYSIDTTTGIVTFTVAPGSGVAITGGCEFDIPMRFDTDSLQDLEFAFTEGVASTDLLSIPDIPLVTHSGT